jgi:hypothetical protein
VDSVKFRARAKVSYNYPIGSRRNLGCEENIVKIVRALGNRLKTIAQGSNYIPFTLTSACLLSLQAMLGKEVEILTTTLDGEDVRHESALSVSGSLPKRSIFNLGEYARTYNRTITI